MKNKLCLIIAMLVGSFYHLYSQENATKINGCWILESMQFIEETEGSQEMAASQKGTKICFQDDGTFTTQPPQTTTLIKGTYHFSDDGKTMYQNQEPALGTDLDVEIQKLDDAVLIVKAEIVVMKFSRVN